MDPLKTPIVPREPHETEQEFLTRHEQEYFQTMALLFEKFGKKPDASKDLLLALIEKHYSGFRVRQSGVKALPAQSVKDLILAFGVWKAGANNITKTIEALKKHNGWNESVETLRRRYYLLQKPSSPERKRMIEMAAAFLPRIQEHFKAK